MANKEVKIQTTFQLKDDEYMRKLTNMKKELKLAEEQVKTSAKQINAFGNNIKDLGAKQQALNKAIDANKQVMAKYNEGILKNTEKLEANSI